MGNVEIALNSFKKRLNMIQASGLPNELQSTLVNLITDEYEEYTRII